MRGAAARASLSMGARLVLAYRLEVVIALFSASIVTLLSWSLWTAVFSGHATVAGQGAPELITYVVVAWICTTFTGTRVDQLMAERVRSGDLAIDLVRPWDLHLHLYLRDLGRAGASLLLTTLPLALGAGAWLHLRAPVHATTWALLALSLFLAHGISYGFAWLVGMASFRMKAAGGLSHLKGMLIGVFSGALIPLDLYPEGARRLILLLPFQGMSHAPAKIFVEAWSPDQLMAGLMSQAIWVLLLAGAGRLAWRWGTRQLVVQGG